MRISEWDDLLDYADKIAIELKEKGVNVEATVYRMYNNDKGIYLRVFDKRGNFYEEYASGIWDTAAEYKSSLRRGALRITNKHLT